MKPVIIIAIAVVCSVVAMIGVLAVIDLYDNYQYEQSIKRYDESILRQQELERQQEYEEFAREIEDVRDLRLSCTTSKTIGNQEAIDKCVEVMQNAKMSKLP